MIERFVLFLLLKKDKLIGVGFSYSMFFSGRKWGDKEGNDKGEVFVMKRIDSILMWFLLRRLSSVFGLFFVLFVKFGFYGNVKKNIKFIKKVYIEEGVKKVEIVLVVVS